jgi:hypothetical protein
MQSDGGWKERGVGALKLNVRSADGKSPRLGTLLPSPLLSFSSFFPSAYFFASSSRLSARVLIAFARDEANNQ